MMSQKSRRADPHICTSAFAAAIAGNDPETPRDKGCPEKGLCADHRQQRQASLRKKPSLQSRRNVHCLCGVAFILMFDRFRSFLPSKLAQSSPMEKAPRQNVIEMVQVWKVLITEPRGKIEKLRMNLAKGTCRFCLSGILDLSFCQFKARRTSGHFPAPVKHGY